MRNHEILAVYGTDYKEMTKKILQEAVLEERIPSKKSRIGIKPNLVSPSEASWGATTHPEIVAGIIEYLQERGFCNLVMLEGSWVGDKTGDAVEVCPKSMGWSFWICRRILLLPVHVQVWNLNCAAR